MLAESLLYNFHHLHILLILKTIPFSEFKTTNIVLILCILIIAASLKAKFIFNVQYLSVCPKLQNKVLILHIPIMIAAHLKANLIFNVQYLSVCPKLQNKVLILHKPIMIAAHLKANLIFNVQYLSVLSNLKNIVLILYFNPLYTYNEYFTFEG